MARTTAKKADHNSNQIELIHETKKDLNPFWRSSLFSDVYLKNDLPREYRSMWEDDEHGPYYNFYQGFINLCNDLEHESFENWREADTVKNWIVPIMSLLGWENNSSRHQNSYIDNTSFTVSENSKKQVYRPDLVYFDQPQHKAYTQKEKDSEARLREIRDKKTGAKIVVEAKYWNRLASNTDRYKNKESDDSASGLGPELQTLKYMELFNHDFGILTDGKTWKLFHKELSQGMERRCFEFDIGNLIEVALDIGRGTNEQKYRNYSKYFFHFFAKASFVNHKESKTSPFVYEVLEYSKKYASSIEEDLKKRFLITMGVACNAIAESVRKNKEPVDLEQIRNVAESHLFNILFVKSCEVRRILPIQSINYLKLSLHEVVEALAEMNFDPDKNWDDYLRDFKFGPTFGGKNFSYEGFEIFNRFINLYEVIHDGTNEKNDFGFEISGFKESIFSKEEWKFAKRQKINNGRMIEILFNLNFIESSFAGRKYQQIPYSYFSPRQLGSIYESFLEYRLEIADMDMIFQKSKWSPANLHSDHVRKLKLADTHIAKKGELFFSPNNTDRKVTGSYYTPDYISKYIVEESLEGVLKDLSYKDYLNITVCDPAMGSGHFLSSALEFLTSKYRSKWAEENNDDLNEPFEVTAKTILHNCIYGVDLNPRAVKLAKMSLWLLTAHPGEKLELLDDQLQQGDSLIGFNWKKSFPQVFKQGGFDVMVGNPPYIRLQNNESEDFRNELISNYKTFQKGNSDIYTCFIERSLQLMKLDGITSFILPNKFLTTEYGKSTREVINDSKSLYGIVNFNDVQIFNGLSTYTCLLFLKKNSRETFFKSIHSQDHLSDLKELKTYDKLVVDYKNTSWEIHSKADSDFLTSINDYALKFENVCEKIFVGLQTSSDPIYILKLIEKGKLASKVETKFPKKQIIEIENDILVPLLKGSEISGSRKLENKFVLIYPYDKNTDGISLKEFKTSYPKCHSYLLSNKGKLLERSNTDESNWWLYSYKKNLQYMNQKKILGQVLSKTGNFNLDKAGKFSFVGGGTAGGYGLIPKKEVSPYFIIGILNSEIMAKYVSKTSSAFRGGYFAWGKQYIKDFSLPANNINELVESKFYKSLVQMVQAALDENGFLNDSDMKKINSIVNAVYCGKEIKKAS